MSTIEIPLTQGKAAIIDAEDYERVSQYKWTLHYKNDREKKSFYARRTVWGKDKQRTVFLHRFILNAPEGVKVDHKNRNGLDNRKENLRFASNSQNQCNIHHQNNWTGFRGVGRSSNKKRFYARIKHLNKQINLGMFDTAEEAARAYDAKAKELHGEFAILNFPNEVSK